MAIFKAPRGTQDILPAEQPYWRYIEQEAVDMYARHGYGRIDTPVFEATGLFSRGVGQGTDIVEKEMYTFDDRSGSSLTLRPEGTAPVCRAYLEHGMKNLVQPVRLYYLAPIFRYERPQSGRMRQHHQFGFEVIGDGSPMVDAEVISLAWNFFACLGLGGLNLVINSIGCRECRPVYLDSLTAYYRTHVDGLCPDCKVRLAKNPLRLLDCKQEQCQPVAAAAPASTFYLCSDCSRHFASLKGYLGELGIPFSISHRLVRGLDYYTRTVFEIQPEELAGQSTIGGGGRYDRLIEEIGGPPTPAAGFAAGIERIILNLKKQAVEPGEKTSKPVYIAYTDKESGPEALRLARRFESRGIGFILAPEEKSLKAQLRQAGRAGIEQVVIVGAEELRQGFYILRDLEAATQENVAMEALPDVVWQRGLKRLKNC